MTTLVGGVVGAAIGFYFGGPTGAQIGWAIGAGIGSAIDPQKTEGPRLQDLAVQTSTYGLPIPVAYGTVRTAGNVIWSTDLVEHSNDQGGKGGPVVTTYSYTVSCAVALCEGVIAGVQKIWANNELIYDVTPGNTGDTGVATCKVTIYPGSETQLPDPRMQAELGAANVPAYRGVAYIVFEDLPLEKFGNRMPNFNFQVARTGTQSRPAATQLSTIDAGVPLYDAYTDTLVRIGVSGTTLEFFRVGTSENIGTVSTPGSVTVENLIRGGTDGTFWAINETGSAYIYRFDTMALVSIVTKPSWRRFGAWHGMNGEMVLAASNISNNISVLREGAGGWSYTNLATVSSSYLAWGSCIVIPSSAADLPVAAGLVVNSSRPGWVVLTNGDKICVLDESYSVRLDYKCSPTSADYGTPDTFSAYDPVRDRVYITSRLTSQLYVLDLASLSVTKYSVSAGSSIIYHAQSDTLIGVGTGLTPTYKMFDLDNLPATRDSFALSSPASYIQGIPTEIDGWSDAVTVCATGSPFANGLFRVPFFTRLASADPTLGDVVSDQCARAGLTVTDIDVSALTDAVRGYLIARQASARSNIEPLQAAYFFDAVESDDALKFVMRGGASLVTIPENDLGARADSSSVVPLLEPTRTQETDLPRIVWIDYLNPVADYQQNSQYERRLTGSANIETTLTLPLVLTDDEAKRAAAANLFSAWANRMRYKFVTGSKYATYEPTDVITLTDGNALPTVRIVDKQEGGDGTIRFEAVSEDASVYSQSLAGVAAAAMPVQTVSAVVRTRLELMDIPLLRDADDSAGFYFAACGYRAGWLGMQLYRSDDGGASWTVVATDASEAVIGAATGALTSWAGPCMVDESSVVNVRLANPGMTLASTTLANLLAGANACLIGSEVVAFRDATLEADGTYTLRGFLRGLRGTSWAMSNHAAGDRFVLFSITTTRRFLSDSSEIGTARKYEGVSFYTTLAQAGEQDFTNTAVGLKPYAPCLLGGGRKANGDLTINWVRCARTGGGWRDYVDASQPEASLDYEVEVWDNTFLSLKRTITGLTSETTTYAYADYLTDFGSAAGANLDPTAPIITHTLTNPGAETGDLTGWTVETGTGGVRSATPAPNSGSYYFTGGTSADTIMRQRIDLLAAGWTAAELDSEALGASLTWYQTVYAANNDNGTMGVRFLDGTATIIGTDQYAPLAQPSTWTLRTSSVRMPAGTRYVDLLIWANRQSGTNNDAYFDDIKLETGTLLDGSVGVRVYQVSATVGRGYKLEGTL